jgi:hypothetical protein
MDEQEKCLSKLIDSFSKVSGTLGRSPTRLHFYRNENDNVLVHIGSQNQKTADGYLQEYVVISKDELFLTLFTGCTGPSSIDTMLASFDEYYGESVLNELTAFVRSLEAKKIVLCYYSRGGGSKAILVMLYRICQKIDVDCKPVIIKPALFCGSVAYQRDFKCLIDYFDTHAYHIYDEDCCIHRRFTSRSSAPFGAIRDVFEEELSLIANSMMLS